MARNRLRSLTRLRHELDRYSVWVATAIFTLLAAAHATGGIDLPGGSLLLILYPLALLGISAYRPDGFLERELRGAAAWSVLVLVAFVLVTPLTSSVLVAMGLPFAIGFAFLVAKAPAAAAILAAFFSAFAGTFQAYIGFSPSPIVDLMLVALWFVLIGRLVIGRPYSFAIWPAVIGCAVFVAITILDMLTADELGVAWFGFRTTVWYMLGFLMLAYAGWSRETYRRIALGLVAVSVIVAAYAVFRWVVGPSGPEKVLAEWTANRINVDPVTKELRTVGSFLTAHQLAFWMAFMAPFCFAYALWATGWKRLLAATGVALCILAMIASNARGPLPGFVVGAVLIIVLYAAARAYPGFKAGIALLLISGVAATAGAVFYLGETNPERLDRYTNVLEPENDPTFIQRQLKWEQLMEEIPEEPFGHGLGTGGTAQSTSDTIRITQFNVDNTYLKVAYEQGMLVMILFVVVMIALLVSIAIASVRTRSREAAAFGMGAVGTLAAMLVSFYTGVYFEVLPIVSGWLVIGLGLSHLVTRYETAPAPATDPQPAPAPHRALPVGAVAAR